MSIIKDLVEVHTKIFLPRKIDHILMGILNDIPLEAFKKDFEAQEGIILNVGLDLRHRRALSEAQEGVIWSISRQGHS